MARIKCKADITPLNVLLEIEKYWLDRHYPLNAMLSGLPAEKFGPQYTVGDLVRDAIAAEASK